MEIGEVKFLTNSKIFDIIYIDNKKVIKLFLDKRTAKYILSILYNSFELGKYCLRSLPVYVKRRM